MCKGYLWDLATMAVSTDRRGIDRKRWKATRRAVLERDQYRCRKDEFVAGSAHPGWFRPCAQIQSRFCAGVQIGA